MSPELFIIVVAVIVVPIVLAIVFKTLYKVPSADQALIITGAGAKGPTAGTEGKTYKIITGGGALVVPVLQKAQYLSMKADKAILDVEGVDDAEDPGRRARGGDLQGGRRRPLDHQRRDPLPRRPGPAKGAPSQMHDLVREVFHGHLRSIIGGLSVEDLIANRNELAQQTRDASADEMQKLGLVVDSLQIQEIVDPTGYIKALGEPRAAEVKMRARIAQADADREATEREQEAQTLKAAAQRDTAIKLRRVTRPTGPHSADARTGRPARRRRGAQAGRRQETAVAELEAQREEQRLDSQVRKPADAAAYQARVEAEGQREARIALAEAAKRATRARRRGRRPQGRAERRGGHSSRSSSRPRAGQADAQGRRGRGAGPPPGARPRARGPRPRASPRRSDRQARRGARARVRTR